MYYSLTNYYQNHRRYVKSRDDNQLLGTSVPFDRLTVDCEPYRGIANSSITGGGMPYAPCGAIANSLFNGKTTRFTTVSLLVKPSVLWQSFLMW